MKTKFAYVIHDVRWERVQTRNETGDSETSSPESDSCSSAERKI